MGLASRIIRAFETAVFGDYTGTPEAQREFMRKRLLRMGYRPDVIERVLREDAQP